MYRFLGGESPTVVDPSSTYADARAAHAFPVTEPSGPEGWQPVSAVFRRGDPGAVLRVGYRSPSGGTAQLLESNVPTGVLVASELGTGAHDEGVVNLDGLVWHHYTAADGDRAYVRGRPDRTVLVVGRASDSELAQLAAAVPER